MRLPPRRKKIPMPRMKPHEITALRNSLLDIMPGIDRMADIMFERLFTIDPNTREMFNNDISVQRFKVVQTLCTAISNLHDFF